MANQQEQKYRSMKESYFISSKQHSELLELLEAFHMAALNLEGIIADSNDFYLSGQLETLASSAKKASKVLRDCKSSQFASKILDDYLETANF